GGMEVTIIISIASTTQIGWNQLVCTEPYTSEHSHIRRVAVAAVEFVVSEGVDEGSVFPEGGSSTPTCVPRVSSYHSTGSQYARVLRRCWVILFGYD
ncbi:hypothetical protein AVEN_118961-1, partial [Araneus ventricosus]